MKNEKKYGYETFEFWIKACSQKCAFGERRISIKENFANALFFHFFNPLMPDFLYEFHDKIFIGYGYGLSNLQTHFFEKCNTGHGRGIAFYDICDEEGNYCG